MYNMCNLLGHICKKGFGIMSGKIKYLLYVILLIIGFSLIDNDLEIASSNVNYINETRDDGIYFSNVSTTSGSDVYISDDKKGIDFGNIVLKNKGDIETITYEITNDKSFNDVSVDILINGKEIYEDNYFIIKCEEFGLLKKGNKKSSIITIELKNNVLEEVTIPLNFTININPVYKGFNLFK